MFRSRRGNAFAHCVARCLNVACDFVQSVGRHTRGRARRCESKQSRASLRSDQAPPAYAHTCSCSIPCACASSGSGTHHVSPAHRTPRCGRGHPQADRHFTKPSAARADQAGSCCCRPDVFAFRLLSRVADPPGAAGAAGRGADCLARTCAQRHTWDGRPAEARKTHWRARALVPGCALGSGRPGWGGAAEAGDLFGSSEEPVAPAKKKSSRVDGRAACRESASLQRVGSTGVTSVSAVHNSKQRARGESLPCDEVSVSNRLFT